MHVLGKNITVNSALQHLIKHPILFNVRMTIQVMMMTINWIQVQYTS